MLDLHTNTEARQFQQTLHLFDQVPVCVKCLNTASLLRFFVSLWIVGMSDLWMYSSMYYLMFTCLCLPVMFTAHLRGWRPKAARPAHQVCQSAESGPVQELHLLPHRWAAHRRRLQAAQDHREGQLRQSQTGTPRADGERGECASLGGVPRKLQICFEHPLSCVNKCEQHFNIISQIQSGEPCPGVNMLAHH